MNMSSMTEPNTSGRRGIKPEFGWVILITVVLQAIAATVYVVRIEHKLDVIERFGRPDPWSGQSMAVWAEKLAEQNPGLVVPSVQELRRNYAEQLPE